jgi:NAD(P)-dependent dehydrogenase (short-subunit alcohol dehydrogenase family)
MDHLGRTVEDEGVQGGDGGGYRWAASASQPDEIATVAVFLAPDDACYVTGVELFIDGGMSQV